MTKVMNKPSEINARAVSTACRPFVDTLLLATAYAQCERERVDKIYRKILADMGVTCDPKHVYQLADSTARDFYDRCNAWNLADGFAEAAQGYCPALCAESLQTEAENALIKAAAQFFPDCTNDRLLCGTKTQGGLETRRKYLDLLIGLVVNSPGYMNPLTKKAV